MRRPNNEAVKKCLKKKFGIKITYLGIHGFSNYHRWYNTTEERDISLKLMSSGEWYNKGNYRLEKAER